MFAAICSPRRHLGRGDRQPSARTVSVEVIGMHTDANTVFVLWCRLTGTPIGDFTDAERREFLARPQVKELANTPYEVLLDAGIEAARHGTLPLERWRSAVETVRPATV
jgi:hypothetical protein